VFSKVLIFGKKKKYLITGAGSGGFLHFLNIYGKYYLTDVTSPMII
jgi:hypothetical protein